VVPRCGAAPASSDGAAGDAVGGRLGAAVPAAGSSAAGRAGSLGPPSSEKPAQAPVSVTVLMAPSTAIAPAASASRSDHRRRAGHPFAA
jgi:hypothetical protein